MEVSLKLAAVLVLSWGTVSLD